MSDGRIGFKPSVVTAEEYNALETLLNDPQNGIVGYAELLRCVKEHLNKEMHYITLVQYVQRKFKTRIKVARKSYVKKEEEKVESFKNNFSEQCSQIIEQVELPASPPIDLFFEDESRFGLFTRNGRSLTAKGVKPICSFQQVFKSSYLFGAFSPITGASFMLEMPQCNTANFQVFLDEF